MLCNFYPRSPRGERLVIYNHKGGNHHFYPRSPRGERPIFSFVSDVLKYNFYPRSPRGERPQSQRRSRSSRQNFYPRSPRGERLHADRPGQLRRADFYPRSPRGERPLTQEIDTYEDLFLSTLPARGATGAFPSLPPGDTISIHAPREGSDWPSPGTGQWGCNFYPRSPRGERPVQQQAYRTRYRDFYPRSPRGERPSRAAVTVWAWAISIHAPREGSDMVHLVFVFQAADISIHAPREGSDQQSRNAPGGGDISIHAPREGSDMAAFADAIRGGVFLSTLPARGATWTELDGSPVRRIFLSTLPARGATSPPVKNFSIFPNFYPRSPRGERRQPGGGHRLGLGNFYPRSPRGERRIAAP